jgi:hypothetical protein
MKVISTVLVLGCISCAGSRPGATKSSGHSGDETEDMDQKTPSETVPIPSEPEDNITDENATSDSSAGDSLTGVWKADCFTSATGFNSIATIESYGVSGKREVIYYADSNCTSVTSQWVFEYSKLALGQKIPGTLSGNNVEITELDTTYGSTTLTVLAQADLDRMVALNDDFYYTDRELRASLNVTLDISGRAYGSATQPAKGSTEFGAFAIIDNNLYWSCCLPATQARDTDLNPRIYKRIK